MEFLLTHLPPLTPMVVAESGNNLISTSKMRHLSTVSEALSGEVGGGIKCQTRKRYRYTVQAGYWYLYRTQIILTGCLTQQSTLCSVG